MIIILYLSIIFFIFFCVFLKNKEGYQDWDSPITNHNVNMPINTGVDCQNKCGSQGKCTISKEQCISDVDCFGCQSKHRKFKKKWDFRAQNDAGKLSYLAPQYSTLTTDIGTQAKLYTSNPLEFITPAQGLDRKVYNYAMHLQDLKNDYILQNQPVLQYPKRQTATGIFTDIGPLPANAYLSDFK
jgi:hypothetical protein